MQIIKKMKTLLKTIGQRLTANGQRFSVHRFPFTVYLIALAMASCNNSYAPWVDPDAIDTPAGNDNNNDIYTGHEGIPRLRGVNALSYDFFQNYLDTLTAWGINHIRWNIVSEVDNSTAQNGGSFLNRIDVEIGRLDKWLPQFEERGIYVSICMMNIPGGRDGNAGNLICSNKNYQDTFVEAWEKIAEHYGRDENYAGKKAVWAYELANEPGNPDGYAASGLLKWQPLCRKVGKAIREKDPNTAIIFPPDSWSSTIEFETFDPDDLPNVIYTDHMYEPHLFTHQGMSEDNPPMTYPNDKYNKETLRAFLKTRLVNFAQKNRVHFYVGEFGAVRWAVGAADWVRDVTELLEEYDIDWAFFSFSLGNTGSHLTIFGATHWSSGPPQPVEPGEPEDPPVIYMGRTPQAWELISWFSLNQHFPN
jgi:aryl-phospho-beta-D-glucosidase BglC (GH1 family)